jgi:hypothetical protein
MLKETTSGLGKFFTKQRTLILVIFLLLAFVLTSYANGKTGLSTMPMPNEGYQNAGPMGPRKMPSKKPRTKGVKSGFTGHTKTEKPTEGFGNMGGMSVNGPSDLLPTNNSDTSLVNSMMTQDGQMPGNLLEAGAHIGLPSTSNSMRNANLQLRADPIIQKRDGCWWGESTISPDPMPIGIKDCK